MTFTKALCVVLLLYSASYGECRCVKKDSKPEKRVVGGDQPPSAEMTALATQIAATLEQQVRQSAQDPSKRGDPHGMCFCFMVVFIQDCSLSVLNCSS